MCTYAVGIEETEQRNAEISFVVAVFKQEHCEVLPFQFEIGTLGDCPAGLPSFLESTFLYCTFGHRLCSEHIRGF